MTRDEFIKLQVGDLVEWNNAVTTDTNNLGIVVESKFFRREEISGSASIGFMWVKPASFWQVRVRWNVYDYICTYVDNDERTLELISLIAGVKK